MPTYTYACDACDHEFEREQRISEKPIKKCPSCGKSKARRTITQGNFILKGGGWYADGYGASKSSGSSESSASETSSASNAKSESKSGGKSESKPGDKSKSKTGSSASAA